MKKRYKYPLYILAALAVIVTGMYVQLQRNIGALPDETRFAHLPYYRDGQFHPREKLVYSPEEATGEGGFIRYGGYIPRARCRWWSSIGRALARRKRLPITGWGILPPLWNWPGSAS